jgi:Mn2+/Fe2+ NRAMP family transporter
MILGEFLLFVGAGWTKKNRINKYKRQLSFIKMDWILSYIILSSLSLIALIIGVFYVTHNEFIERRERERMYRIVELREGDIYV